MQTCKEILPLALKGFGIQKKFQAEMALFRWPEIVGADIAAQASPVRLENGVLVLTAGNSAWCHHLSMMKAELAAKINAFCRTELIRDIRFQNGAAAKYERAAGGEALPLRRQIARIRIDKEAYENARRRVAEISEEGLRRRVLHILTRHMALERYKKNNRWRPCASCTALCPPETSFCTACERRRRGEQQAQIRALLREAPWLTYAEMNRYEPCTPEVFIAAKTALLALLAAAVADGAADRLITMTLVMLATGAKPEMLNERLIRQTLAKFRRKKYVSTPGV